MINNTLYAKYIKERLGQEIIENESGFIIYKLNGNECFIAEMFVDQGIRKSGLGKSLLNELKVLALDNECEYIAAHVHQFDKNAHHTLSAAFKCGFKIHSAQNNVITIILNINGGLEHGNS